MSRAAMLPLTSQKILLMVAVSGWIVLWYLDGHLALPAQCGLSLGHWLDWGWDGVHLLILFNPPEQLLLGWAVMLAAMMTPGLAVPLRRWGPESLWLCFVYFGLWLAAGAVLLGVAVVLLLLPGASLAYGLLLAGLWQMTPLKRRCLTECHAGCVPEGIGGALRFSAACIGRCWAWMLLPLLATAHAHFPAMVAVAGIMLAEAALLRPKRRAAGVAAG